MNKEIRKKTIILSLTFIFVLILFNPQINNKILKDNKNNIELSEDISGTDKHLFQSDSDIFFDDKDIITNNIFKSFKDFGSKDDNSSILLIGSPTEIGTKFGQENKNLIINAYNTFNASVGKNVSELKEFAQIFINIAKALNCSYWIEEANATADVVGLDRELYIAFLSGRYRGLAAGYNNKGYSSNPNNSDECTSFVVYPPATKNNQIIFHKTRDNFAELQSAYFKHVTGLENGKEVYKYFGTMGVSDFGLSYFINEKGLAGSCDMGGASDPPKYDGLMNHLTLRYFAEHCKNVNEVNQSLHYLVSNGYTAGADRISNYLFIDKEGNALHIADNSWDVIIEEWNPSLNYGGNNYDGIWFTVHRADGNGSPIDALVANYGNIDVRLVDSTNVAKHTAVWGSSSLSGGTFLINQTYPEILSSIFISFPGWAYSVPTLFGANTTPKIVLNGTLNKYQLDNFVKMDEDFEQEIYNEWENFYNETVPKVPTNNVTDSCNENFSYFANKIMNYPLNPGFDPINAILYNVTQDGSFTHLTISEVSPYNSLVLYMPFDTNTSSTYVYDYTSSNNDGMFNGDAFIDFTKGVFGSSLKLDGTGDYINLSRLDTVGSASGATISAWIYAINTSKRRVILDETWSGNIFSRLFIEIQANNTIRCGGRSSSSESFQSKSTTSTIPTGQWVHVAGVINVSGDNVLIYVNGNPVSTYGTVNFGLNSFATTTPEHQNIGAAAGVINDFTGWIDEFMLFNTTLTQDQILSVYNNQSARFKSPGIQNHTGVNINSGFNYVDVSTDFQNLFNTNLSLKIGFYNDSWFYTDSQVVTGLNRFYFSEDSTNITLNYTFISDNQKFYTPVWLNASINLGKDLPPQIYLISPENNTIGNNTPDFKFIVTDDMSTVLSCTLWLDNGTGPVSYGANSSVLNNTLTTITANKTIPNNEYLWWIECYDRFNTNISEKRNITIITPGYNFTYLKNETTTIVYDYQNGSLFNVFYNDNIYALKLNYSQTNGSYTSQVFDVIEISQWNNISWIQGAPYQHELPNNRKIESELGGANMSGNVLLMHMNELSGPIVDYSGTGNNGSASGVTYGVVGKFGSALSFDGVNDYVGLGVNALAPDLAGCSGVTISTWINPSSLDNGSADKRDNIADILINSTGASHYSAVYLTLRWGGRIWFGGRSQPGDVFQSVETVPIVGVGVWQHVVGVLDFPSDKVYVYYNGVKVGEGNVSFGKNNLVVGNPSANDVIGANPTLSTHFFAGKIDEFVVWNRSLSENEIIDVYKRGALSLNVSVRSCDDGSCGGEGWVDIDDVSPQNLSVFNNRYFQYRFDFKTDNLLYSPELYNVTINYCKYDPVIIYVDDDYSISTPGWQIDHFDTIHDAMNASTNRDTIIVYPGTYYENQIIINKSLAIQGSGWSSTVIDGGGANLTNAGLVRIIANDDVTFSGFTLRNAGGPPNGGDGHDGLTNVGIYAQSSSSGVTYYISYNKIIGTNESDDEEDYGFYTNSGLENLIFTYNIVTQTGANAILIEKHPGSTEISHNVIDAGCYGIDPVFYMTYGNTNITSLQNVSYNTIDVGTGSGGDRATAISFMSSYSGSGPMGDGRYTNILISYNIINNIGNNKRGISLYNDAFGDGSKGEISNSIIKGNIINGIAGQTPNFGIRLAGLVTNTTILENIITDCDKSFIGTTARNSYPTVYPTGTVINYNNFEDNSFGLLWEGSLLLDARFNWWGDASGPYHFVLNPVGLGDNVSDNVWFAPWYDASYPGGNLTSSPPQISNIVLTNSTPKDTNPVYGWENITVTVTDDVEISDVRINITYPDMHTENISMINAGGGLYHYNTTFSNVGTYNYFIWAIDTTSVSKTSGINSYVKPPNWDINIDGVCNIVDVSMISTMWMQTGPKGWTREDVNNDGKVNIVDVSELALHWMETWS